jgi:para-nitrobenzyl esterase
VTRSLVVMIALAAACSGGDDLHVTIDSGPVHGGKTGAIRHFVGIPYAAPPIGGNRWRAPQPPAPWTTVRDAIEIGTECPQTFLGSANDEDCLFINVWTPSCAHGLPVMVWLHGGGFIFGSGGDKYYDGGVLGGDGVVVVTLNYRLGALGFLAHPALDSDDPSYPTAGNYGLEDQRAALEWVQRNIHVFGGDPTRVTLFGESAGGFSTCVHYLSTRTHGLFGAAIVESGLCGVDILAPPHATAESQGVALANKLGCGTATDAAALACLRNASVDAVLAATALPPLVGQMPGGQFYQSEFLPSNVPNVDGYVIAKALRPAFTAGGFEARPLIVGTNRDEGSEFHSSIYALAVTDDTQYRAALAIRFGAPNVSAIVAQYPSASFASPNDALAAVTGDAFFVCPARATARGAAQNGAPVFRYTFEHALENPFEQGLGVFHGSELPFVFGNDDFPLGRVGTSGAPLASAMESYWTQFAKVRDPSGGAALAWPPYDVATDPHLVLDTPIAPGTGLKTALCDFWDALPPS